jgi:hypothetical protein
MTRPSLRGRSLPPPDAPGAGAATLPVRAERRVRRSDRWWDLLGALLAAAGVVLFFYARHAIAELADGTYAVPKGATYVARTDLHVAQTRLALWLVGTGVTVGILAAVRHHLRARR